MTSANDGASTPLQRHRDPAAGTPPDTSGWPTFWRDVYESPETAEYRAALCLPGSDDMRAGVLDDLSTYFHLSPDECRELALNWGEACIAEWTAAASPADFHRSTQSSSYSLLWYAYLQATGVYFPVTPAIARAIPRVAGAKHLDLGSGAGVTSQLFQRLGYETTLADIAVTTLDFARYRLGRRNVPATFLDLNTAALPSGEYDLVTAIDVLPHVPEFPALVASIHRALKPGGYLYANINVRPEGHAPWHLYTDDAPLRRQLQNSGFEPVVRLDSHYGEIYRRVDDHGAVHAARAVRDAVQFSPLRPLARSVLAAPRHLLQSARNR